MKFFYTLPFLLFVYLGSSQTFKSPRAVQKTEFDGHGKGNDIDLFVESEDGRVFVLSYKKNEKKKDLIIDAFDNKTQHLWQKVVDKPRDIEIDAVAYIDDQFLLFGTDKNNSFGKLYKIDDAESELVEYRTVFDLSDEKLSSLPSKVLWGGFVQALIQVKDHEIRDIDTYGIFTSSPDDKYHLFARDLKSKGNNSEMHFLMVMDDEFNVLYTQLVDLPIKDKLMEFYKFYVNDTGEVFIVAEKFENGKRKQYERKSRKEKDLNSHFEIIKVNKDEVKVEKIDLDGIIVEKVPRIQIHNDELYIHGFYQKEVEEDFYGLYTIKIDKDLKVLEPLKSYAFSDELLGEWYENVKEKKRQDYIDGGIDTNKINLNEFHIDSKGNPVLVTEKIYESYYTTTKGSRVLSSVFYNDFYVLKLDSKQGQYQYFRFKKSDRANSYFSYDWTNTKTSSATFLIDDNLHFFVNARKDEYDDGYIGAKKLKKISLIHCYVDINDGSAYQQEIFSGKPVMSVRRAEELKDNSILINGSKYKSKDQVMLKVKI